MLLFPWTQNPLLPDKVWSLFPLLVIFVDLFAVVYPIFLLVLFFMKDIDECDMEEFDTLLIDSSEKTIAVLLIGGVLIRSRNGPPSRKGCVVNDLVTKASTKRVRPSPPPPRPLRTPYSRQ